MDFKTFAFYLFSLILVAAASIAIALLLQNRLEVFILGGVRANQANLIQLRRIAGGDSGHTQAFSSQILNFDPKGNRHDRIRAKPGMNGVTGVQFFGGFDHHSI